METLPERSESLLFFKKNGRVENLAVFFFNHIKFWTIDKKFIYLNMNDQNVSDRVKITKCVNIFSKVYHKMEKRKCF